MHRSPSLASAAALALCTPVSAQGDDHLVGLTRVLPALRHVDHDNCRQLDQCSPANFPDAVNLPAGAGGTAWDPIAGGAWITNGTVLAQVDGACNYICPPRPIPMVANAVAAGLEVVESRRRLYLIDSAGGLHQYDLGCPARHLGVCQTGLGPVTTQFVPTGLAADEALGLLFVALGDFANGDSAIAVIDLANSCQVVQRLAIQGCPSTTQPFGAFTGLCADWCRRVIYATDGHHTMAIRYAPAATGIALGTIQCCHPTVVGVDPMIGLAVRPGGATTFGQSCANGVCPPCPMRHSIGNDPNVGNTAFHLVLEGAPVASLAWAIVGFGPCGPPGLGVPPLCGPLWVHNVLGTIGPVPTGGLGGTPCAGDAAFRLPLPLIPSLCGTVVSSQTAVLCASITGQIGTSLSNCTSFRLQGN